MIIFICMVLVSLEEIENWKGGKNRTNLPKAYYFIVLQVCCLYCLKLMNFNIINSCKMKCMCLVSIIHTV